MDRSHSTSFNLYKDNEYQPTREAKNKEGQCSISTYQQLIPSTLMRDMPDLETLALLIRIYRILDMASARNMSQYLSPVNGPIYGLSTTQITHKV